MTELQRMGKLAKEAAGKLASAGSLKDTALLSMAKALEEGEEQILRANEKDLEAARQAGMRPSLLDRLALNHSRIAAMAEGIRQVAAQQDPIGEILEGSVPCIRRRRDRPGRRYPPRYCQSSSAV